jgi:hypothetical protein
MVIPKLTHQQVIGALRSTGSTDTDVLFAKKEELLTETRRMKLLTIAPLIIGGILTVSLIGAIVGIPAIIFGWLVRKTYNHNIATADAALAEYMQSIRSSSVA